MPEAIELGELPFIRDCKCGSLRPTYVILDWSGKPYQFFCDKCKPMELKGMLNPINHRAKGEAA